MKATFTLIPSESRRLIAKGMVMKEEFQRAMKNAYVIISPGTTTGFIAQEILGHSNVTPYRHSVGVNSHRLLCITDTEKREPMPTILYKGEVSPKNMKEALTDFHPDTVVLKGANLIDPEGNAAVILGGFDGGGMAKTVGVVVSQGLKYLVPVGLEKLVPSVKKAAEWAGAKTFDYTMGADYGIMPMPNAHLVTEIEALRILTGVEARHVASGGIGESAGAVVLIAQGEEEQVKKAINIIEDIKGEPTLKGFKGVCETCRYACRFAGTKAEDLPAWLAD